MPNIKRFIEDYHRRLQFGIEFEDCEFDSMQNSVASAIVECATGEVKRALLEDKEYIKALVVNEFVEKTKALMAETEKLKAELETMKKEKDLWWRRCKEAEHELDGNRIYYG